MLRTGNDTVLMLTQQELDLLDGLLEHEIKQNNPAYTMFGLQRLMRLRDKLKDERSLYRKA